MALIDSAVCTAHVLDDQHPGVYVDVNPEPAVRDKHLVVECEGDGVGAVVWGLGP